MQQAQFSLTGHGWCLIPRVPFEIGSLPAGDVVVVHHIDQLPKLRIAVKEGGQLGLQLGPGTKDPLEVLEDYYDGEPIEHPGFSLTFDRYEVAWPEGTAVFSTDASVSWSVELTLAGGSFDEMLYMQGPFERADAPLMSLVGPNMTVVGTTSLEGAHGKVEALELDYLHEGQHWRQWRYLSPLDAHRVVLVTAQASTAGYAAMLALGTKVATEIRALG